MDLKDAASRLKTKAGGKGQSGQPKEMDWSESYRLRARMLGVLLQDARLNAERSTRECAELLRVAPEVIEAWEYGEAAPSLPQLELLAYYFGVPLSHFWGNDTLESRYGRHSDIQEAYLALRDRMIGALLSQARQESGLSIEDVAAAAHVPVERLAACELGEQPLPMHELNVVAGVVKKNLAYFLENGGHVGAALARQEEWQRFASLPEEMRVFVANPRNLGYLEIALMFSQMPTEKLRQIGESLLTNITM
jgi:transcriptional regulator with XRE-family HTH domain